MITVYIMVLIRISNYLIGLFIFDLEQLHYIIVYITKAKTLQ